MDAIQIHPWGLAAGYGLLIVPFAIFLWAKVEVLGKVAISVVRMTVQLLFVGLYLQIVFRLNNPWLNGLWVLVMAKAALRIVRASSGRKPFSRSKRFRGTSTIMSSNGFRVMCFCLTAHP